MEIHYPLLIMFISVGISQVSHKLKGFCSALRMQMEMVLGCPSNNQYPFAFKAVRLILLAVM
jgi:hypothetical protein